MKNRLEQQNANKELRKEQLQNRFNEDRLSKSPKEKKLFITNKTANPATGVKSKSAKKLTPKVRKNQPTSTKHHATEDPLAKQESSKNISAKYSDTALSIMDRLIKGERPEISKSQMIQETKQRYNQLPEVQELLASQIKKNQHDQRLKKAKVYDENTRLNLSRSTSKKQIKSRIFQPRDHIDSTSHAIFEDI